MDSSRLREVKSGSPLGQILAAGITSHRRGRDLMKESIEEVANHVVHELERYLNTLGTVAAITPLLGLLGTVIGMIKVFTAIQLQGTGNAAVLAGGISEALITTAAGLTVAIPSLFFHRYFQRKVDELVIYMEQEALKLVEVLNADRTDNADVKHPAMAQAINR
jgi:biopolymer transport protein ExbB